MNASAHHDPDRRAIDVVRRAAHVFADATQPDLGPVLAHLGAAPLALLGEAKHGSEEFYRRRAELTLRRLASTASTPSPSRPTGRTRCAFAAGSTARAQ